MAPRVLVCLDDNGVAHVLAARLTRDGIDGVVVGKPGALADEAKKGVAAVVLQDRYASGEEGTSLLRRIRIARGDIAPAVVLYAGEIPAQDRHLFEHQWRVQSFLPVNATPQAVADAVRAAGVTGRTAASSAAASGDHSELDVEVVVTSPTEELAAVLNDSFDDDDDDANTALTVEMSRSQLQRLRQMPAGDPTGPVPTTNVDATLSQLPPPGGDDDVAIDDARSTRPGLAANKAPSSGLPARSRAPGSDADVAFSNVAPATSPGLSLPPSVIAEAVDRLARERANAAAPTARAAATPTARVDDGQKSNDLPSSTAPAGAVEGDAMQIQELQRTQTELKKALLAERKARETAQKRVEELEARLSRMGEEPTTTQGVPAEGVFEDLRYPVLLARCRAEGFTGSIVMQTGGAPRTVFLKDGLPVAFSSSEPGQRIGKLLVAQGRITDEQYMKAATLMVERSIKLTDALVELRLIDAESLAVEQRNTTRDQIIQGFEFVQGRFQTVAGAAPDANTSTFDFGPGEIYVQGYRRYAPANEMLATYETLRDKYLVSNARLASHRPKLGLTGDDERFLRLLGEAYTVEEACERCGAATDAVARLLAALQALDLVEEWSPGVEQFRSRLRAERQRHAEELARVLQEARAREDRLLETFQKALAGHGGAQSELSSSTRAGERRADDTKKPAEAAASSASAPASPSSQTSAASTASTTPSWRSDPRAEPARTTSSTLSATLSSSAATSLPPSAARATAATATPASSASMTTGASSPTTASAVAAGTSAAPTAPAPTMSSSGSSSGSSTGSLMAQTPAPATATTKAFTEPERSPAERKYREGLALAEALKFDEAELALRDAVRESPNHAEYFTALARVLLDNPHYERSATLSVVRPLLDHALALAPDDAEASRLLRSISDFTG